VIILCGSAPTASFTSTGTHTLSVTYTGTTSTVDSTTWNFGDGSPTVKGSTALHTYASIGIYTVCVTAWSMCGNSTACKTVTVTCVSTPVASFTETGITTINTTYTGTTIAIDSIVWNFGDGSPTVKGTTATHSYAAVGSYNICVTAYSLCGSNTFCKVVIIPCIAAPTASFTAAGHISLSTSYTGTSIALDSIVWNFGDGSPTVKGTTAAHTYTAVGTYSVCVTAYNPCGSSTFCMFDTIPCISAPIASFTDTGGKTIGFTYIGTTVGMDSVVWSFGDGATSTGTTVIHTYTATGIYHVCVIIYTPCGADSSCSNVTISSLAINKALTENISVYPNPANDELNITGVQETISYRLLNVTGTCIDHGELYQGSNIVSMQHFVPGIYILEVTGISGKRNNMRVIKE
jgi:PKD repeat protein